MSTVAPTPVPPVLAPQPGRSRRRLWLALAVAVTVVTILVVGAVFVVRAQLDPGDPVRGVSAVAVVDDAFEPAAIEVPVGTAVTWRWQGDEEHNVVADEFESPTQTSGEFAYTFAAPGSYDYECTLHFFMRGEVLVTESGPD